MLLIAIMFCFDIYQCVCSRCQECSDGHKRNKRTKSHELAPLTQKSFRKKKRKPKMSVCQICQECDAADEAITFCQPCQLFLCKSCTKLHKKKKRTREHPLVLQDGALSKLCKRETKSADDDDFQDGFSRSQSNASSISMSGSQLQEWDGERRPEGLLDVTVVCATHLPKMDMWGRSDVYGANCFWQPNIFL